MSHHVSEEIVPVPTPSDNAPNALAATPTRSGFLERTSRMLFGGTGPRQQEESNVTERRRAVDPLAVPPFPSEEQQLRQLQLNAAADVRQRPQREAEPAKLDARRATFEAALASSRPRTPTWERASASLKSSPNLSPPRDHRSPRRSASPQAEMTSLMQLFQLQMQQAADREQRHEEQRREDEHRHEEQRREDRREAAELRREAAERETRLEARLLQTTSTPAGAYRIGVATSRRTCPEILRGLEACRRLGSMIHRDQTWSRYSPGWLAV